MKEVSFQLETGEILGVFGRNGCGKSTLLKMLFGTITKGSIAISIDDTTFNPSQNISQKQIAYLPQDSFLPRNIKVRDVIPTYFSEAKKQDKIFYDLYIASYTSKLISQLSIGQVRYLEVLLLANTNHSFLMLDEPFSMIEPIYKEQIKELLKDLKTEKGIIITDHYYSDVLDISSKNILIKEGKSHVIKDETDLHHQEYLSNNTCSDK